MDESASMTVPLLRPNKHFISQYSLDWTRLIFSLRCCASCSFIRFPFSRKQDFRCSVLQPIYIYSTKIATVKNPVVESWINKIILLRIDWKDSGFLLLNYKHCSHILHVSGLLVCVENLVSPLTTMLITCYHCKLPSKHMSDLNSPTSESFYVKRKWVFWWFQSRDTGIRR